MNHFIISQIAKAMATSDFLRTIALVCRDDGQHWTTGGAALRQLAPNEIAQLESQGNYSEDWSQILVAETFDCRRVRGSVLVGKVVMGRFTSQCEVGGVRLNSGVYNSIVANTIIGNDALVRDVRLLSNYWVGAEAIVHDCGRIACAGPTNFGMGVELPLGIETGGRNVPIFAEIDVATAAELARRQTPSSIRERYGQFIDQYSKKAQSPRGIIGSNATVCHTPVVDNSFIGASARLDGATRIVNCLLFGGITDAAIVESGACVTDSVLQWGTRVASLAVVDRSVLTECSGAERHAKVTSSLLGPNTVVAQGEVSNSLVGPFVGFHHQAMMIATLWPDGKGNISAGALAGSNHTGRAADQEFCPGEGLFIGLGANVKFPTDLRRSPYSIIASGVTMPPQSVAFPFSLIHPATMAVPGGYNEIIPAWILTDSLYTIIRNQEKFRRRNRARRWRCDSDLFHPVIIDAMCAALTRLEAVQGHRPFYAEQDIEGLGRNILVHEHLQTSINGYRFFIRYYALCGLLAHLGAIVRHDRTTNASVALAPCTHGVWKHQRHILRNVLQVHDDAGALADLPAMAHQVAADVERSKAKDERRGGRVFSDYSVVHAPTAHDPIVIQAWEMAARIAVETDRVLDLLPLESPNPEMVTTALPQISTNGLARHPIGSAEQ